jgi:class 3 adenylate cyclase
LATKETEIFNVGAPCAAAIVASRHHYRDSYFLMDTLSSLHFSVASLYVLVILLSARDLRRRGTISAGFLCVTLTVVSYLLTHGFALNGAAPLRSAVSFVAIAVTVILMLQSLMAGERLAAVQRERTNLARFFSPATVEHLVEIDEPLSVARRQQAAVLFADMVEFTAQMSGSSPEYVIGFLRALLGLMSELVFSHHRSIDKFLGDGLMAVFGLPLKSALDATNAARCALEINKQIALSNANSGVITPTQIAIGIHYGEVIQGDIGSDKRLEFTAIGDVVNLASRIEDYCRTIDAAILVTDEFIQALLMEGSLELAASFNDEGEHLIRGYKRPIHLFSVMSPMTPDDGLSLYTPSTKSNNSYSASVPSWQR